MADPKSVHALLNLGITRIHLAKYEEAADPLREALRLEPGLVAAHQNLGAALVETDQFDEAQSELLRAAKSPDADQAMVELYLGKLYARTGDFDKSIASFNNYLEKPPRPLMSTMSAHSSCACRISRPGSVRTSNRLRAKGAALTAHTSQP